MFEHFDWLGALRSSPVMLALVISAVLTVGYVLERLIYFAVRGGSADQALTLALGSLRTGNEEEALRVLNRCTHPFGSVAVEMLRASNASAEAAEEKLRIALSGQRMLLERHLGLIGTLGRTTPLVGLLGTVWGTMRALHEMSRPSIEGSSLLASGVAEALMTTAAGLAIAVPALFLFNHFTRHVGDQLTVAENHARTLRLEARSGARPSLERTGGLTPSPAVQPAAGICNLPPPSVSRSAREVLAHRGQSPRRSRRSRVPFRFSRALGRASIR